MKALLISLCLLFCLSLIAQNDSHYLISLEKDTNKEIESDFYINNIYDGRHIIEKLKCTQI